MPLVLLRTVVCLMLLSFGASGVLPSAAADDVRCEQTCPDDDEKGQCAPDCDDCICCAHLRPVAVIQAPGSVSVPLADALVVHAEHPPASPYLGEILHVPIAA